jgi:hypothetical protein
MNDPAKTEAELPELPEPSFWGSSGHFCGTKAHADSVCKSPLGPAPVWTDTQMRSFATAAVLQERERCAKICEARAAEHEENGEDEGDDRFLVYAKHERRCAAAIRAAK